MEDLYEERRTKKESGKKYTLSAESLRSPEGEFKVLRGRKGGLGDLWEGGGALWTKLLKVQWLRSLCQKLRERKKGEEGFAEGKDEGDRISNTRSPDWSPKKTSGMVSSLTRESPKKNSHDSGDGAEKGRRMPGAAKRESCGFTIEGSCFLIKRKRG